MGKLSFNMNTRMESYREERARMFTVSDGTVKLQVRDREVEPEATPARL